MEDTFLADMGERVIGLRRKHRLSQEETAERADTTKQTISLVENAKQELRARNIVKIADALGVSTDYLLKGTPAEADLQHLDRRLQSLTAGQFDYLETLINKFIDLCEKGEVK